MDNKEFILKSQEVAMRSFGAALKSGRVPHAYLLDGEEGTPLFETATLMAKSLLCDNPDPYCDMTCTTCRRIDAGNYHDLVVMDGGEGTLNKESVKDLIENFSKSSLEKKGKLVYIIHLAEKLTDEAENSLLKFLEEPSKNTTAILTTNNIARILPTIRSRCEILRLVLPNKLEIMDLAIKEGVSQEDAFLLAPFHGTVSSLKETSASEEYRSAKQALMIHLQHKDEGEGLYFYYQNKISALVKQKKAALLFLSLLIEYGHSLLYMNMDKDLPLLAYHIYGKEHPREDPSRIIFLANEAMGAINANVAVALSLDHLAYSLIDTWTI